MGIDFRLMIIYLQEKSLTMTLKLTFAVLASLMLSACQKTDTAKFPEESANKTPALITAARNFFDNNIATIQSTLPAANKGAFSRRQINKIPVWEKASIAQDKTKGEVVIVPLQYEKPLYFKTNFGNGSTLSLDKQSDLWIYKDVSGKFKADVRITLPDKTYQEGISKSFAGYLLEEDWTGNSIATYLYKNGKVSLLKKNPLPLNSTNTVNREGNICYVVNWYQCDYIGNEIGYNCQLLYSDYIPCEGGAEDDGEGGGGGGGDGEVNNTCINAAVAEFQQEINGVQTASQTESIIIGNIDQITKSKNPKWTILIGAFGSWQLSSQESGVIKLIDAVENKWAWQSLAHGPITLTGSPLPTTSIEYDQGFGTSSFTPETAAATTVLYARMSLDFSVTYRLICNCPNVPIVGWLPPVHIDYTSTSTLW